MQTFLQDLRYAVRLLLKKPAFTVITVVTLAVGIGLNTAVFSVIDALLLRPLPGTRNPDELVDVFRTWPGLTYGSNSIPHYVDLRDRTKETFAGVAAWDMTPLNLSTGGRTERIMGQIVSANFFSVMGATPERGRTFLPEEDVGRGAHPVAVVSHAAWQGMFGGDPQIVGRTVLLNGQRYAIVGVMPPEFRGPIALVTPTMWVPLMQLEQIQPGSADRFVERGSNSSSVIARLAPGVTIEQARDRMKALLSQLAVEYPDQYKESGILLSLKSEGGIHPQFKTAQMGLTSVVMAVVVMLLLIACVNVANLFLARARGRWREMAVRLSLGARRSRLVRQLLTESLVFAVVSGTAGLVLASWAMSIANRVRPPIDIVISPDLRLSVPVLVFSLGISLVTAIMFGLAPALQATRPSLVPSLKGEAPAGGSRSRMSRSLVVAQMALSLILLVSAGLFLRNLRVATTIDKGFVDENLLIAQVDPGLQGYSRARAEDFYRRLTERLGALPGVRAVGLGEMVPLGLGSQQSGVTIPGYTPAPNERMSIDYNIVAPGYFEAMGIPLVRGRGFTAQDDSAASRVMVINRHFANRFWPGQDPVGKTVRRGSSEVTVVGLVPDGKYRTLGEETLAYMYVPQAQYWNSAMTIHVRTTGDPAALGPRLRAEVAALDSDLPVSDVRTMTTHLGVSLLPARLAGAVLGIFGVLGLALAAVGMYGVMSYSVAQRTREIGIRVAIGAARGQVLRLVLRQGLSLVAAGAVIGVIGVIGAARLVRGVLYGGTTLDPITVIGVSVVLIGVATIAIWVPARRASSVDPMVALRTE